MDSQQVATDILMKLLGGWRYPAAHVQEVYRAHRRVRLDGRPVLSVESVTTTDNVVVEDWMYLGSSVVMLPPCGCRVEAGPGCAYWKVDYWYGWDTLPETVAWAVDELATEIDNSAAGRPCALPQRVTSVNRQGVSWTLIDPMDFLDKGRTGLPRVDLVLSVYNPTARRRLPRVWSPEFPPGEGRIVVGP